MQDGTMVEHPMGGILFAGGRKPNLFHPIVYGDVYYQWKLGEAAAKA